MKPSLSTSYKTLLSVCCVCFLFPTISCDRFTSDLTVKYFANVTMTCDHPDLNISEQTDVESLAWILPDGSIIDSTRKPDPKLFKLSMSNNYLNSYNLTVLDVSDAVFGYYVCIVVYRSHTRPVDAIRWGLNVDGADFSELMATYTANAIVGGIAAGVLLAATAMVYMLWHFRYSNRQLPVMEENVKDEDMHEQPDSRFHNTSMEENVKDEDMHEQPDSRFHNTSYVSDDEDGDARLESNDFDTKNINVKM